MQLNNIQNSTSFGIKISPHLLQTAQNHYNYNNVPNKRHLIWAFNQKAEEYGKFGFDDYILDYEKKLVNGNWQHYLVATRDSNPSDKITVSQRQTLVKIINHFLEMSRGKFKSKMNSQINK
jgi:hypothetical protein